MAGCLRSPMVLGGQQLGEVASRTAVETLLAGFRGRAR